MKLSSSLPRYHPINNPPYQINYRAKRSGKHITCTKRRITFQFGFSNTDAIASGCTEGDCRGEEHEVVLIWSHITGKRQIFMDGKEVHMSKAAMGNTKFTHTWGISGNHFLKLVANATSPTGDHARTNAEMQQFDLFLDGMSYFEFCQIYQLGACHEAKIGPTSSKSISTESISRTSSTVSNRGTGSSENERNDDVVPPITELKIDLFDAPSSSNDILTVELTPPTYSTGPDFGYQSSRALTYSSSYDDFSPVNASSGGYQKSFNTNGILNAYNNHNSTNAPQSSVQYIAQTVAPQDPPQNCLALVPAPPAAFSEEVQPFHHQPTASFYNAASDEQDDADQITKSMRTLVNLDDLSNPNGFSKSSSNAKQSDSTRSLQSLQWALAGRAPTLSEIQNSMRDSNGARSTEVMRNSQLQHQQHLATNSMVVGQMAQPQQYAYHASFSGSYGRAY